MPHQCNNDIRRSPLEDEAHLAWTPTHSSAAASLVIAPQFLPVFRDYTPEGPLASFLQSVLFSSAHYSGHATLPSHQFPLFQVLNQLKKKNYSRYMRLLGWVTSASCPSPSLLCLLPSLSGAHPGPPRRQLPTGPPLQHALPPKM